MSLLLYTAFSALLATQEEASPIAWEPFETRHASGGSLGGRIGRLTVPERHTKPDGPTIEIAFAHFPSTAEDPGPPIFYLAGGPGGSGIDNAWVYGTARPSDLLAYGDLIAIDQRGVGRSQPSLTDGPEFSYSLPFGEKATRTSALRGHSMAVRDCMAYWREQGVDLEAYNTVESADDVEAVAAALGFDEIVLYGTSYGTHLGLTYLRRHPERVARAVLSRVEGPDHSYKLPSQVQMQLERFAADLATDELYAELLPDVIGTLRGLLAQLAEDDITVEYTPQSEDGTPGEPVELLLSSWDLRVGVSNYLGDTRARESLAPALLQLSRGDWSELAETSYNERSGSMLPAMSLMMDCSSGASAERLARLKRERKDPANLLGDAINWTFPELCEACDSPDLGAAFRTNFECDVPTLFISGASDPRTPIANAVEVMAGFSNAAHFIATNVVHDSREWMSRECSLAVWAFLQGESPESQEFELPPFEYGDPQDE